MPTRDRHMVMFIYAHSYIGRTLCMPYQHSFWLCLRCSGSGLVRPTSGAHSYRLPCIWHRHTTLASFCQYFKFPTWAATQNP
eukprot:359839-Chlamydomonas_euryale.AAC.7